MRIPHARLTLLVYLGLLGACTERTPLAPGCRPWLAAETSTEPPTHCLFFPSGVALDPLGDVLYVSNTNADLSFGGGAVAAIDLLRYERAVSCFRRHGSGDGLLGDELCGRVDCRFSGQRLGAKATLEATEQAELDAGKGKVQLGDFDRCYCSRDPLDASVVNCESQRFILRGQTIKTGNFTGPLRLLAAPFDTEPEVERVRKRDGGTEQVRFLHRTLYLPVRGDPSVTHVEVRRPLRLFRAGTQDPCVRMHCSQPAADADECLADEPRPPGELLGLCDDAHRVQYGVGERLVDAGQGMDTCPADGQAPAAGKCRQLLTVPPDPFGLFVDRGAGHQVLVTTHLSGGEIATFQLSGSRQRPGAPILVDIYSGLFADRQGRQTGGAFAVAPRLAGDLDHLWYATSRNTGTVATFRLLPGRPKVVAGPTFDISSLYPTGQDVRDLLFEPGGARAFMTVQSPPSLAVLDTRLDARTLVPRNQVTSIVDICLGPSRMTLLAMPQRGVDGVLRRVSSVLISCYLTGQVAFVDVNGGELVTTTQVGRGPMSLALNFGGEQDGGIVEPCADPLVRDGPGCLDGALRPRRPAPEGTGLELIPPRAYVAMYIDNAIAVVDLDPGSPTYRRLVSRIGLPSPKQVQ